MPHFPKPWFREGRGWFVTVKGRQIKLADDETEAFSRYHRMMAGESPSGLFVSEVVDAFLEWCQRHRSAGTFAFHKIRCQSFDAYLVANGHEFLAVENLKPMHVEDWIAAHPSWNRGMIRGAMQSVCRAMNWAAKQQRIDASPLAGLEKPRGDGRDNVIDPPTFAKMLGHVKDQKFRDLLTVAWETGCRPQEIVRVEARHLVGDRWVFPKRESKGKKRIRVVHLTPAAQLICQRLAVDNPAGPMFRNRRGKPWHPWAVNCRFCRLKEKLGTKFALGDFRHSFTTRLLKAKVDPITIGVLHGHADLSMIANTYAHVGNDSEHLQKALNAKGA